MSRRRWASREDEPGLARERRRPPLGIATNPPLTAPAAPPLPTFIIIGAQKSATRWLRQNLGKHPDIFTAPREVKYFNHTKRVAQLGPDWYRAQFDGWAGEPVVGEATPGYMMLGHGPADVARRIRATVPDVRLIAVLRNPVDRAHSALVHHKRAGRIHPRAGLLETVRRCRPEEDWMGIVTGGWYAVSLQPFVELFGDRLLVLLHDDIGPDPRAVFAGALRHVGAAPDFVPTSLERVVFSNRDGGDAGTVASAEDWAELFEYFRDDVDRLERLLGRDLSIWRTPTFPR
jgi:Sulfotransferase domain